MNPSQLFERVVQVAPSFEAVHRDHMGFYKELLPHVLMADLLRFLESTFSGSLCEGAAPPSTVEIEKVFQVLDSGLVEGDERTQDAIAVSFVEGIEHEPFCEYLRPYMGRTMQDELERQKSWTPSTY